MEALLYRFTLLSSQACQDKNFDPSSTDDLMKLFEIEAYKSWAAMELEQEKEVKESEVAVQQAEEYLESDMESAMDEFRRFEEEMERMARSEMERLERAAESARKMGNLLEKAATIASKKYMEAAHKSVLVLRNPPRCRSYSLGDTIFICNYLSHFISVFKLCLNGRLDTIAVWWFLTNAVTFDFRIIWVMHHKVYSCRLAFMSHLGIANLNHNLVNNNHPMISCKNICHVISLSLGIGARYLTMKEEYMKTWMKADGSFILEDWTILSNHQRI